MTILRIKFFFTHVSCPVDCTAVFFVKSIYVSSSGEQKPHHLTADKKKNSQDIQRMQKPETLIHSMSDYLCNHCLSSVFNALIKRVMDYSTCWYHMKSLWFYARSWRTLDDLGYDLRSWSRIELRFYPRSWLWLTHRTPSCFWGGFFNQGYNSISSHLYLLWVSTGHLYTPYNYHSVSQISRKGSM